MATPTSASPALPERRALKILMLHGYTQSGASFHAKTRALEKALDKAFPAIPNTLNARAPAGSLAAYPGGIRLIYPTGPHRLRPSQIPGYVSATTTSQGGPLATGAAADDEDEVDAWAWWRRDDRTGLYTGLDEGMDRIAETICEVGGVDAVMGFSQGGAAAAMVTALLEPGRKEKMAKAGGWRFPASFEDLECAPLKFGVVYSGFFAPHDDYKGLYEGSEGVTKMLHYIGGLDTVVEESRSRGVVDRFGGDVVLHPGGHFVPIGKEWVAALVGFIRQAIEGGGVSKKEEDVSVEDMDLPF
ncbi:hypothetical protein V500_01267 [Pseudogymnoascus sp. VKM F-4518 (FW-2643)]|nr:hypothetical protein V500_01267 [Pseudogymnoascus sp. VKM F-4518 (FW-2643)]